MKLLLLPLILVANFAFATIPNIERIEGASRVSVENGIRTAYIGLAPACDPLSLGVCHESPYSIEGMPSLDIVFHDDVTDVRIATAQGWTVPVEKNLSQRTLTVSIELLCQVSANLPCADIAGSVFVPMMAFVDANQNGIKESVEEAIAVHAKFVNPTAVNGVAGTGTDGISGFVPYPADGAVYIEDILAASNFPTLTYGSKVHKVRVFVSDQGLAQANPVDAMETVDLDLTRDGTALRDSKIEGLINGVAYVFRIALLDEAGNMVLNFPPENADATCDAGAPFTGCPWAAVPEEVQGR